MAGKKKKPGRAVTRVKARADGWQKPIAERVVRTGGGLWHEREFVKKEEFRPKGMVTQEGRKADFTTVHPKGRPDIYLTVGCLKRDYMPDVGMCGATTVQKTARRVTTKEAKRLQAANPALLVISNPADVEALGYNPRMVKKLTKAYKRFHFTNPAESVEVWRPDSYPKGFVAIGECELFRVRTPEGKTVTRKFAEGSRPHVCMTEDNKDVFILIPTGNVKLLDSGLGIPSGTAIRVDYKVPPESGRNKWSSRWYHWQESNPTVTADKSGKAVRISGPGLRVTPRGIVG